MNYIPMGIGVFGLGNNNMTGDFLFANSALSYTTHSFTWGSCSRNIDFFNFPAFLFITPMFLLSGTFFPLSLLPGQMQAVAVGVLPLTHVTDLARGLVLGRMDTYFGLSPELMWVLGVVWIAVVTLVFFVLAINMMKKKLIK